MVSSLFHQIEGEADRRKPRGKNEKKAPRIPEPVEPSPVYQLKVTLQESHPAIWRRVQVPSDLPLPRLHGVLQIVMGWTNSHMHQFKMGGHYYRIPEPEFDEPNVENARQTRLNQIAPNAKSRFIYEYDFGDGWEHAIVVEKIMPPEKGIEYPRCIAGERACPPEDVGGVWGYHDFLQAFRNPKHPEHAELVEWAGKKFDPERFDLSGVNGMLKLYPAWRDEE
ncbi:MAG: plasmid pRiA4b ORF-3 family protein [Chloroflexi bacterium]|nr:plasmid pRiA4b ORF-3 family protein [Chloroflexota bacterium]